MRFGVIAMQIDALIPEGLSGEQVLAHLVGFDHAALVKSAAEQGFKVIELGGDLGIFLPQTFAPPAIDRLLNLQRELGISYTLHLPLWSVEPSTPLEAVRQGSVQAVCDTLRATLPLSPEVYVLHATGSLAAEFYRMHLPQQARALLLSQFKESARRSIATILDETGLPSRRLAIETIEFPFEYTLNLAEELDTSICFDTGHVLAGFSGRIEFFEALQACLPRLAEIHLHDAPLTWPASAALDPSEQILGYGKDHQPLGSGDLNTERLLDTLAAAQFKGPIVFELPLAQALASLATIRQLRPQSIG